MVINYRPFFVFWLISIPLSVSANYQFTPKLKEAYNYLFQLKTPVARQLIKKELEVRPSNGIAIYLENYTDVVECIITGEEYRYELLLKKYDKRIDKIESFKSDSPYHRFVLSEMKMQIAFTKLYFQDKMSAFWSMRSAYKLTKENLEKNPGFKPSRKTAGILEILIGSVPKEHQWIVSFSGFKGTTKRGLSMLKNVIEKDQTFKNETQILYWLAHFHLLRNDPLTQLKKVDAFYEKDRDNLLTAFIYATMLTKQGRNEESLNILNRLPSGKDYVSFKYINSMRGDCYLYKGEYQKAIINYRQYIKHYKGKHYLKSAYFKLSLSYWILDDFKKSDEYRKKTIEEGVSYFDSDKKAYKYANQNIELHKILLKAQLYHDGGYYEKTLSLLNNIDVSEFHNSDHKVEYFYRKGRTYQKIHFYNKAIRHFISAINTDKSDNDLYFAPNSCLQLGHLFYDKKEYSKAKKYYKLAMGYSGHEYESSINTAAKRGLKKIEAK